MKSLIHANVLTDDGWKPDQAVIWRDAQIVDVCDYKNRPQGTQIVADVQGDYLVPGFIDIQVNGGGGVLFNDDPSVETIARMGAAHRQYGTTGFFPTLISDTPAKMAKAITAVNEAILAGVPGVLGIHLEGPHLNPDKRGVHDEHHFKPIGASEVDLLCSLKKGKTIVTLAPEMTTPNVISTLVGRGVIVSAGHTMASYDQAMSAFDAGLSGVTHLYNAMPQLLSRAPGLIAAALEDARIWCGVIVDGHHVDPAMLQLALRAKADGQFMLVTDAMPSVGMEDKNFKLGEREITVKDGRCVTGDGTLAGSDLDMMSAVRNATQMLGLSLRDAAQMASHNPAQFIGVAGTTGYIGQGAPADILRIGQDLKLKQIWQAGCEVF